MTFLRRRHPSRTPPKYRHLQCTFLNSHNCFTTVHARILSKQDISVSFLRAHCAYLPDSGDKGKDMLVDRLMSNGAVMGLTLTWSEEVALEKTNDYSARCGQEL